LCPFLSTLLYPYASYTLLLLLRPLLLHPTVLLTKGLLVLLLVGLYPFLWLAPLFRFCLNYYSAGFICLICLELFPHSAWFSICISIAGVCASCLLLVNYICRCVVSSC
jgi:hypothetical protein